MVTAGEISCHIIAHIAALVLSSVFFVIGRNSWNEIKDQKPSFKFYYWTLFKTYGIYAIIIVLTMFYSSNMPSMLKIVYLIDALVIASILGSREVKALSCLRVHSKVLMFVILVYFCALNMLRVDMWSIDNYKVQLYLILPVDIVRFLITV